MQLKNSPLCGLLGLLCVTSVLGQEPSGAPAPPEPTPSAKASSATTATGAKAAQAPVRIDETFPLRRNSHCAGVVGTKIYIVGGISNEKPTEFPARVDCLETRTGEWSAAAPLPTPRANAALAECDGKLYVLGGQTREGEALKLSGAVECYDPATNTWKVCKPMTTPRARLAAASIAGRVFAIGGLVGSEEKYGDSDAVDEYDPKTDAWKVLPPIRTPRHGLSATVASGRVWAVGGMTIKRKEQTETPSNAVESMIPRWNTWRSEPAISAPRGWPGLVAVGETLFCFGSVTGQGEPERLDRGAKAWKSLKLNDMSGAKFTAVAIGNKIYLMGGEGTGERMVRVFLADTGKWEE